jgi:glycopeptide antibiotics resistance protein
VAGVWDRWSVVILATLLAVPLLVLLIRIRARQLPARLAAAEILAIALTLPWLWMILTPLPQPGAVHPVPFQEVPGYLAASPGELIVQLGGNLAVFAAFGALAPVRWRLRPWQVAAVAAVGSSTVESLQYLLGLGRVASVDDVLLNTAGAVLASLVTHRWWRVRAGGKGGATLCR